MGFVKWVVERLRPALLFASCVLLSGPPGLPLIYSRVQAPRFKEFNLPMSPPQQLWAREALGMATYQQGPGRRD